MKKRIIWIICLVIACLAIYAFVVRGKKPESQIQYSYDSAAKGNIVQSISATGILQAKTAVDVKSKAGGEVVLLAVDVGSIVKQGDLIAKIDPKDTQASYDQAAADLASSQARASQAQTNLSLQTAGSAEDVRNAQVALQQAVTRLDRTRLQAGQQPEMTSSAIASAQAAYDASVAAQQKLESVTIPQLQRDSAGALDQAKATLDAAQANDTRQQQLLAKGYVAQAAVDQAHSDLEAARSAYNTAQQKVATISQEISADRKSASTDTEKSQAALAQAKAASTDNGVATTNVAEAEENVRLGRIALQKAQTALLNDQLRKQDIVAARADTVRNKVTVDNAKVQLESTTVVAPRDGVVTTKYLEEGTIIPPGTSTFAQGTSLVQISDISTLYVVCTVDEADVANVHKGQRVKIVTEAFPDEKFPGVVDRVDPAATTTNNVTTVSVRVRILPGYKVAIKPGMNATCEFITLEKDNVLMVPSQAINNGPNGPYVLLKGPDPKHPVETPVKIGDEGNDGTEILSGLKEGDQVVTSQLDLAQLKAIQDQMAQDQSQSTGLAGGGMRGPQSRATTTRSTTGAKAGGARAGGARAGGGGARGGGGGGRGG